MQTKTKRLTTLAMLSALAYILMVFLRIPIVLFLKYDPKDIVITIGGFLYGPLASFAMSIVVSFAEMVTVSDTGPIGAVMNVISTCAFSCTAAFIYKRRHTLSGAVTGLAAGVITATVIMLLWNYLLVPVYTPTISREAVMGMLMPVFLPFNLLKGGLNAAFTMLLYKPVKLALGKSHMIESVSAQGRGSSRVNAGTVAVSLFVIATCVLFILSIQGRI